MSIFAAGGANAPNNPQQNSIQNAKDLVNLIKSSKFELADALKDLSQEMKAPSTAKELGQSSKSNSTNSSQQNQPLSAQHYIPENVSSDEAAAFAGTVSGQTEVEKKKKKKKFEEKLALLAQLEGKIDLSQLSPEEKEIVEQFFQNLNTIRKLKREIKQLENQEIYYNGLLEQKKQAPQ